MDTSYFLNYTTRRKCFNCKNYIILEKEIGEYIYYKEKFYHVECLRNKLLSKRVGKLSEDEVEGLIKGERENSEKHSFNVIIKNHLYCYLMDKYNLITIPNYIYTKLESIFNGSYKNMSCPIPIEHMFDMFQRKQSWLNSLYHKQKLDEVGKLNYDIAVILTKYKGYVDWLEKSKVEAKKAEIFIDTAKINMNNLCYARTNASSVNILDEDGD